MDSVIATFSRNAYEKYINSVQNYNDSYRSHHMWRYYRNRIEMAIQKSEMICGKITENLAKIGIHCKVLSEVPDKLRDVEIDELDEINLFFLFRDLYDIFTELPLLMFSCVYEVTKNNDARLDEYTFIMAIFRNLKDINESIELSNFDVHESIEHILNKNMKRRYEKNVKFRLANL